MGEWIGTVKLTEDEGWSERPAYLHFGSAGTMAIQTTADSSAHTYSITGLDYGYQDIKLQDWDKTVDNIPVRYLLRDKTCQELKKIGERNAVEGKFGNGKRKLGLNLIMAKLKETTDWACLW